MTTPPPDCGALAIARLEDLFAANRRPGDAERMTAYMRGRFRFFGIRAHERRRLQRDALAALPSPTPREVLAFARACWRRDEREFQYAAADLVRRHAGKLAPADLARLERLITSKAWWDTVDELAVAVGEVVRAHPESRAVMDRWLASDDRWLVRVAILHQERWRDGTDAAWLFSACRRHAGHPDFFIRKAIGWALRSHGKRDPAAVQAFLDGFGSELSGLSRREAERGIAAARR